MLHGLIMRKNIHKILINSMKDFYDNWMVKWKAKHDDALDEVIQQYMSDPSNDVSNIDYDKLD